MKIICEKAPFSSKVLKDLHALSQKVFGNADPHKIEERIASKFNVQLVMAYDGNKKPCGFKLGYQKDINTFYSWLGGVENSQRSKGVAKALMKEQHQWVQSEGYSYLETKCYSTYIPMIVLNLKSGFEIIDVEPSFSRQGNKVVLKKLL